VTDFPQIGALFRRESALSLALPCDFTCNFASKQSAFGGRYPSSEIVSLACLRVVHSVYVCAYSAGAFVKKGTRCASWNTSIEYILDVRFCLKMWVIPYNGPTSNSKGEEGRWRVGTDTNHDSYVWSLLRTAFTLNEKFTLCWDLLSKINSCIEYFF